MGKDKKLSKGKQEKDFGQEAVDPKPQNDEAGGKKKSQRKKKNEEWEEDVGEKIESLSIEDEKKDNKKTKKNTNNKRSKTLDDSEDEEEETAPRPKAVGKASAFQMLAVEDDSASEKSESENEEEEVVVQVEKKAAKKSKKKERRKNQDDEEVDKMLEEIAAEIEGKKQAPAKAKEQTPDGETAVKTTENTVETSVETTEPEVIEKKKKKKKQSSIELETNATEQDGQEDEDGHTVKSAAQKKKEKKEREKQKKLALGSIEKTKKPKEVLKESEIVVKEEIPEDEENDDDLEEDGKKKKKKKKGDDDDKKDKKRPGKKQIAAMQEALKKLKEDEEKRIEEEEQKQKAAEEAELLRLEKLKLEQERKERKKQKEKEKRERLKAEGKLLTKAQKQARARMEATLQVLREQGMEVPQIGEKRVRAPRLGDRRKPFNKKKVEEQHELKNGVETEAAEIPQVELEIVELEPLEKEESAIEETLEEEEEVAVKDTWDESSGDEEKEEVVVKQKAIPKAEIVAEESEDEAEEDSDEEDDEDDESSNESEESSDESSEDEEMSKHDKIRERIRKRKEEAEKKRSLDKLRSPIVCVLGHVDTGKTKILDKIRNTHVQDGEAGGITQQIGATMIPKDAIKDQCKMVKNFLNIELKLPGLLIIDTPGHESFSNLRSRGSSLCDIAILVVDIMHGLEPQTIESINLLKKRKTPFIVALNKIDRLYEWRSNKHKDVQDVIASQQRNTKQEFDERTKEVILQFSEQALNAALFYENKDPRTYVSLVPTSAGTGDGMGNLMSLVVDLTQNIMPKKLTYSEDLQATVLEVKAIPGLGTTIDVILVNGSLREGDTMILAGHDGPVVTQIRSLLMPQPMKELRVKTPYREFKEIEASQGVKITGKDLDKAIAGLQLLIALQPDEVDVLKEEVNSMLKEVMNAIKLSERGVYVQASTLGSLEALLEFLRTSKIPYSGIRIGPVVKKDVMKASIMLEHDGQYASILAFDVKVERDAQDLADNVGVKIFQADIIYHLFDKFMAYRDELKAKKRDEFKHVAVFPCKLRILPQFIFNSRDPIVLGVSVEAGVIKEGTPLCVPSREFLEIGTVTTIEINHKTIDTARKGQEVCIKIEPLSGEAPKMFGRHFDDTDALVSKITRQSIDACKDYFRDDLQKTDWQLMVELKKLFQIM